MKMDENGWKYMYKYKCIKMIQIIQMKVDQINESGLYWMKVDESGWNGWKRMKTMKVDEMYGSGWKWMKWMKVDERGWNGWKWMK